MENSKEILVKWFTTGRWMDKEVVVHIYNGILLSYKKEWIWVRSNELHEPGACYTEWSESERERQILYINAYIWNFERQYQWSYRQGSKGDTDVKNRVLDSTGEGGGGMICENSPETCTLTYIKQTTSASSLHEAGPPKLVLWDTLEGWGGEGGGRRAQDEGGHMYTYSRFMLMYGPNHHSIAKQLLSN